MPWKTKDTAKNDGVSIKEATRAAHDARDHSGVREGKDAKEINNPPSWAPKDKLPPRHR